MKYNDEDSYHANRLQPPLSICNLPVAFNLILYNFKLFLFMLLSLYLKTNKLPQPYITTPPPSYTISLVSSLEL